MNNDCTSSFIAHAVSARFTGKLLGNKAHVQKIVLQPAAEKDFSRLLRLLVFSLIFYVQENSFSQFEVTPLPRPPSVAVATPL